MPTGVTVRDNESFEQALRRLSERRKREMIQARKKMLRKMAKQRRAGLL
jgi:ribosomal protein S21